MVIKLLNQNEELIEHIDATNVMRSRDVFAKDLLTFNTPYCGIEKRQRIVLKDNLGDWQEYIIQGFKETRDQVSVFCEHSFYETFGDFVEDKRPTNVPAQTALSAAMETTRWTVLSSDNLGNKSTNFYRISAREAAALVCEVWGGELEFSINVIESKITSRNVRIRAAIGGDFGKRFEFGKDLIGVERSIDDEDIVTALYGFGKGEELDTGGFGRRLEFSSINGGKAYLENNTARLKYGRLDSAGGRAHIFGNVLFDQCEDKVELKSLTNEELIRRSEPRITYKADVIMIKSQGEAVSIGDQVAVIDDEIGRVKARVLRLDEFLDGSDLDKVELGNFVDPRLKEKAREINTLNVMRGKMGVWDNPKPVTSVSANLITGMLDEWNRLMNLGISEGMTTALPGGFLFESKSWAMHIGSQGFRIANSKKPDGSWNYVTIGTGNGFLAEHMFAQTIIAEIAQLGFVEADKVMVGGVSLTEKLLSVTEQMGKGGENLLLNPTFGSAQIASTKDWQSGYTMGLLLGRFNGKTMGNMLITLTNKTMGDLQNNVY